MLRTLLLLLTLTLSSLDAATSRVVLNERQLADLEMLQIGAFSPLTSYMTHKDYKSVCHTMRLANGKLFPLPIVLDVKGKVENGDTLELTDLEGTIFATLEVAEQWSPDKEKEAKLVFGTSSRAHPGVAYLLNQMGETYVSGKLTTVQKRPHFAFQDLRATPAEMRKKLETKKNVVAFQTRNPMHRAHFEITKRAAEEQNAHLLLQPIVGPTKPGDIDPYTRVRCYRHIVEQFPEGSVTLNVLPLAMRMAGPREALWHALIRKNYGATHFIVGRDHAGPGNDENGTPFYGPYDAQELVAKHTQELGITMVPFQMVSYLPDEDCYLPMDELPKNAKTASLSGTELRRRLRAGEEIPDWFSFPEIIKELRAAYPAPADQGLTVLFTGLSASGKSTLAKALENKLAELQHRKITLLDGDIIRTNLSKGLGFSKEGRSTNVRRVGFVAQEVARAGGIALCSLIAPYEEDRQAVRSGASKVGNFLEVYVSTPLDTCMKRDPKGLYAKAIAGEIKGFTGIDDPYEAPAHSELSIDTTELTVEEGVEMILETLRKQGMLRV